MQKNQEELTRIVFRRNGNLTSASMDYLLAEKTAEKLGGESALRLWVQGVANDRGETKTKLSLSRILQREALLLLLNEKNDQQELVSTSD